MTLLIVGIVVFLGCHLLPAFPHVRQGLIERLGKTGYRVFFSVVSLGSLVLLVWGFATAPFIPIWSPPYWTRYVAVVMMLPAFIILVAAYVPGRIKAVVKSPFLVALKIWALAHLIANGGLAEIILFGSFLAFAVFDQIALKGRQPTMLVETSGTGRARNDLIAVVFGVLFYLVFLVWLHPLLIGRVVVPY